MVRAFPRRIASHVMTMSIEMMTNAFVNQVTIATRTQADVSHSQNALKMKFFLTGLVFVKMDIFAITIGAYLNAGDMKKLTMANVDVLQGII